jgi:hypothetical protein
VERICLAQAVMGSRKLGNESSGSVKGEKFLDDLSDCQLSVKTMLHAVGLTKSIHDIKFVELYY